jgi:hypothetical protein
MKPIRVSLLFVVLSLATVSNWPALAASRYTFTTINVPAASITQVFRVNNSDQVVGFFDDVTGKRHGFIRDTSGNFTTIDVPGAFLTHNNAIDTAGRVVGNS